MSHSSTGQGAKESRSGLTALLTRALAALREGRIEVAEADVREAVSSFPEAGEAHNALGVVLRASGRLEEAEAAYRQALAIEPGNARAHNNLADIMKLQERYDEAIAAAREAIRIDRGLIEAYKNIAQCHYAAGDLAQAAAALGEALRAAPADPSLYLYLGKIEQEREAWSAASAAYAKYLEARPDDVEARVEFAATLMARNRTQEAFDQFRRVLELDPDCAPAQFGYREAIAQLVPSWHIPMMNEPQRNHAYRDAIRKLVRPDDHVLEIGTGAGLLALLSAEAGARAVTTCEMVPVVAEAAAEVIGRSAHADRIKLVAKRSTDLRLGEDVPEQADVLVSEILANDFVGEGVLPSLIDARKRMLKPGARVIPASGELRAVLVGGKDIEYLLELGDVCGFDMRSFASLRPWRQAVAQRIDYDALSHDVSLLRYDFESIETLQPVDTVVEVEAIRDGRCYGVLQWIRIGLAPGIEYENHPMTTQSVWNKVLYAFPEPVDLAKGDILPVRLWQRDDYLYVTRA